MNKELRAKTDQELIDLVIRLKGQLLQYRFKQAHGELEKHHLIKQTKRLLARIYTILTERQVKVNIATKLNSLSINQNKETKDSAKEAKIKMQKEKAEKAKKSLKQREENKKKVAAIQAEKPKTEKPKKVVKKTTKAKLKTKLKAKPKSKKTTNKLSSRTRRKGA